MSSTNLSRKPWAKLIFNPEILKDPVEIVENRFVIGRSPACNLNLRDQKHVSAQHCAIERTDDGKIFVVDLSNNGTFVNVTERIGKGKRRELTDGSVVFLAKKKGNVGIDIPFTMNLVKETPAVAPATIRKGSVTTTAMATSGSASGSLSGAGIKRKVDEANSTKDTTTAKVPRRAAAIKKESSTSSSSSGVPSPPTTSAGASGAASSFKKASDIAAATPAPAAAASASTKPKDGGGDSMADNLLCSICFDIIHDCISLQPCMHCFCAGCYSDWMQRSEICPECRGNVDHISKNHVLNNVINAYLANHPEKKRSDDDLKDLDAKNKITADILKPKSKPMRHGPGCECSECEDESDSSDDDDVAVIMPVNVPFAAGAPHRIPQCRLCVGHYGFPAANARPNPLARPCPPGQPHVMCTCCFANMPDRRQEHNPALPAIACSICQRTFCNLVFGCTRVGCTGCLERFRDMRFLDETYNTVLNENVFETNILKNYLTRTGKTWIDVTRECTEKMDRNDYACADKMTYNLNSQSIVCQACALRNFRTLVYQYRSNIPKNELPADVTARPDCHWGKNCRTQKTKFHHAENFNHICEQTRFAP